MEELEMKLSKLLRITFAALGILILGLVANLAGSPAQATGRPAIFDLQRPPFLHTAHAQTLNEELDIGEYLDQEAGISAWCHTPGAINLSLVRDQYQIIEIETADYILGSVSVPGYTRDEWDTHVYVHTDGWILAYYMNTDVTGRIIHLLGKTIDSTLVENMVGTIAGEAGMGCSEMSLYDFRHPDATHMLLVAENDADGSTYTIYTPSNYIYMDRAYAKWNIYSNCDFKIDGVLIPALVKVDDFCLGPITYAQLVPDITHTVDVNDSYEDYGVLIITYAVP
jgi:hypothetical protein